MDLFFKNPPYFISVYLDFPLWKYLVTVIISYVVLHLFIYFVVKSGLKKTIIMSTVFSLYFALVIGMTLLGSNRIGVTGALLNPFYGIKKIVTEGNVHFLRGMLSNVLLFVPCGVFYRVLDYKYKFLKGFLYSMFISGVLEILQYVFLVGYFETSDILCNIIGMMVGMKLTEWLLACKFKNSRQTKE